MKSNNILNQTRSVIFLFVFLFLFQNCGNSQVATTPKYKQVIPGDKALNTKKLQPHQVVYKKKGGRMVYTMESVEKEGEKLLKLNIEINFSGKEANETTYLDANSLAFVTRDFYNPWADYSGEFVIENNKLHGKIEPGKKSSLEKTLSYDNELPHGVFEPAIFNYFVTAMPLEKGYKASVPLLSLNNDINYGWANVEVVGEEKIKAGGKEYDTWKVVTEYEKKKTLWIDKQQPFFIQMKTKGSSWKLQEVVN